MFTWTNTRTAATLCLANIAHVYTSAHQQLNTVVTVLFIGLYTVYIQIYLVCQKS